MADGDKINIYNNSMEDYGFGYASGDPKITKITNYPNLIEARIIPRIMMNSLLDLENASYDVNGQNSRHNFLRLIYYDTFNPYNDSECPLPTLKQRKDIIFNGEKANNPPNKEKGYRMFAQRHEFIAQQKMQTQVRIFVDKAKPYNKDGSFYANIYITFIIINNFELETIIGGRSRSLEIALNIIEAFNGCHIAGIGALNVVELSDEITDGQFNTGYVLRFQVETGTDSKME